MLLLWDYLLVLSTRIYSKYICLNKISPNSTILNIRHYRSFTVICKLTLYKLFSINLFISNLIPLTVKEILGWL